MSENQGTVAPAENTAPPAESNPVVVTGGWVVIDGCKVARALPGGMIAFPDKCRGRVQRRGSSQVSVNVADLAQAVQDAGE